MNEDLLGTLFGCLIAVLAVLLGVAVGCAWSTFVGWLLVFVLSIFFVMPPMTVWHYLAIGIVISWFMPKPAIVQKSK